MMISSVTSQKLHEGLSSNHTDAKFWGPYSIFAFADHFLTLFCFDANLSFARQSTLTQTNLL